MQDKKLVGILRSFDRSTSEATAISLEVIKHFIADSSTLPYKGFPRGGYGYQSKPSNELRQFLGLPKDEHGVFVTYVRPQSPADKGGLKERDIILEIAGYEVLQNGSYKDEVYGDLELKILTSVRHKVGDELKFKVWRDKKEIELTIKFDRNPAESQPVESYRYDKDFEYYIAGGLLFIELSRPFLKKWGEKWWTKAPAHLVNIERNQWKLLKPDQKVVVLASIMRTPSNAGYDDFRFNVLKYVNGTPINGLKDLRNSIETNQKPLVELTFEEDPGFLVLDPSTFGSDAAFLQNQYGIPNMTNMKK